jgi:small-conductance mechanosensitive channel
VTEAPFWYRDSAALWLIAVRYLPWLAALNLAWEAAHVRLYTLWQDAELPYIAFSVMHCTLGDVLIGALALLVALIAGRERALARWRWRRIAVVTTLVGVAYTVFSEWMNLTLLRSWTYAESMPKLELGGFELGLTPLAQWLVVAPLALHLARKTQKWRTKTPSSVRP